MVDSAAYEFENTAKYLTTAEEIAGDYVWCVAPVSHDNTAFMKVSSCGGLLFYP